MIRDVMVWLDGGVSDEIRLAAVADISRRLQPKVIIGLFLNPLPLPGPVEGDATAELIDRAREAGDEIEKGLARRLQMLERPVEIRRFDILADDIAKVATREARCRPACGSYELAGPEPLILIGKPSLQEDRAGRLVDLVVDEQQLAL